MDSKNVAEKIEIADKLMSFLPIKCKTKKGIGAIAFLFASAMNGFQIADGVNYKKPIENYNTIRPYASHAGVDSNSEIFPNLPMGIEELFDSKTNYSRSPIEIGLEEPLSYVVIDKDSQIASVYQLDVSLRGRFFVSTGENVGDKKKQGDKKTPNGIFKVVSVEKSKRWIHEGELGAYGNYFSRLDAGSWSANGKFNANAKSSIGLHGTNEPERIGSRASDGCVRFHSTVNDYLVESGVLKNGTYVGIFGK